MSWNLYSLVQNDSILSVCKYNKSPKIFGEIINKHFYCYYNTIDSKTKTDSFSLIQITDLFYLYGRYDPD